MHEPDDVGIASRLLGSDPTGAGARLSAWAAVEAATRTLCRLDCAVDQLRYPKPWLRLEELVGLATAARAAGEEVEYRALARDRLGLLAADNLPLGATAHELGSRWTGDSLGEMRRREAVVAELLRAGSGAAPASLVALALRLEVIAHTAGWQMLPMRQIAIDAAAGSATIASADEASEIGDYLLAQPAAFERIGISKRPLPGVVASPALLTATDADPLGRLARWLQALASAAEAAHRRLERYRRFEQRMIAVLAACDRRRRTSLERVLALFSGHWMLWPRRAAALSGMPHNTAWRAMNDAENEKLVCRVPGSYPGGAGMYVLAPVAEAAGICAIADEAPLPAPAQGELRLDAVSELDTAEAEIDRLIGGHDDAPTFFSLDDVEL